MAEETTKKKGQLAAAVLAGSALTFSSFAVGVPAAWSAEEATPTAVATASEEEDTPEAPVETPEPSASETTADETDEAETGDLGEEGEPTEQVTEEETSAEDAAESTPESAPRQSLQQEDDSDNSDGDDGEGDDENEPGDEDDAELEDLRFEVSPRSGPSGTQIHVSGSGFTPGGDIDVRIVTEDDPEAEPINYQTFTADVDGELNDVMTVPGASGLYHVTATDVETDRFEVDTFNITNVTMDIDPRTLSDVDFRDSGVTLTIEELDANQDVDVAIGNRYNPIDELSGSATANESGVATYTIQGAEDLADIYVGEYSVVVTESGDEVQLAEGSFEVTSETPRVNAFPQDATDDGAVRQGEILYVTGYNATADNTVTIDYGIDGVSEEEVETEDDGQFATEFEVPEDTEPGVKTLTLTDDETGETATAQYTVAEADTEDPSIELGVDKAYPGQEVDIAGEGFTSNADIEISINPVLAELEADDDGSFATEVTIPEDLEPGDYELTVANQDDDSESVSQAFEVLDPADQVVETTLSIDPERIELDDFIGAPDDGAGVVHVVEGLEAGEVIDYEISGPEYVNDYAATATANDDGVASFTIHGYDVANPAVYLGEYTTVVTYEDEGEDATLSGSFTVYDEDAATGGSGDSDDSDDTGGWTPGDVNGSTGLAQTGANGLQLGFLAGGLLLAGAALVMVANRKRLFGRTI